MTGIPPEFASGFGRSLFEGLDGIWGLAGGCATAGRCGGALTGSLGSSLKQIIHFMRCVITIMAINRNNEVVLKENILRSLYNKSEVITATRKYVSKHWKYIQDKNKGIVERGE